MKKQDIVFVIDCDEVIRPLIRNMVDFYNQSFNQHMHYEDVTDINSNVSFPMAAPDAPQWFFQDNGEKVYLMRPPIEGAVEAIRKLRMYGTVIIATYQETVQNKIWTTNWFDKYGIEYDDLFFGKDKRLLNCDFFIDDDPKYFKGSVAKHGIFINSVHNQNEDLVMLKAQTQCKSLTRFNSLKAFADNFEKYYNKK